MTADASRSTPSRMSIAMPPTFLNRNVTLRVGRSASRWIIEAEDGNGQLFDTLFTGYTGSPKFATKSGAVLFLAAFGYVPGQRLWTGDLRP